MKGEIWILSIFSSLIIHELQKLEYFVQAS